jgi:alpha,alpha-trehalase
MMRKLILILFFGFKVIAAAAQQQQTPDQLYGQLFIDVQMQNILQDGKTFVDCIPKKEPSLIVQQYLQMKKENPQLDLKAFVASNFIIPESTNPEQNNIKQKPVLIHINELWKTLRRNPLQEKNANSTLLNLPFPYIVPGGRFREIYYWDSYFTMLGLRASGEDETVENMVKNFAFLIDNFGHIPNGNRNYYLSRSQPPFFSLMVELLAQIKNENIYVEYLPQLEKEYNYWMDKSAATHHVVKMPDGSLLNRYYDQLNIPRQESYKEDVLIAQKPVNNNKELYRDIRSAAESGWDFSSRWLADGKQLNTMQTTQIIPVDLNCLLFQLETTLQKACTVQGNTAKAKLYRTLAANRKKSILKYLWSAKVGWFTDYQINTKRQSPQLSLAGMYPMYFSIATPQQAIQVKSILQHKFLMPGGLITSLQYTHQQWDAPNGWAPLQWISIMGLSNYGYNSLARNTAERWVNLNKNVYQRTGKMMEKYNVVDIHLEAGGGEYNSQDGFGWTNGVFLALIKKYNLVQ